MALNICNFVFIIDKNNDRIQNIQFSPLEKYFSKNDDLIAGLKVSRRWPIQAYLTSSPNTRHNISLPKSSI